MDSRSQYTNNGSVYDNLVDNFELPAEELNNLSLDLKDDDLVKMLVDDLEENIAFWQQKPWELHKIDKENIGYLLGLKETPAFPAIQDDNDSVDNRLFSSVRAILSYATGRLAVPELTPSRGDETCLKSARKMQKALYQHAQDNKVDLKARIMVLNLITRKRGPLKLRFDKDKGAYGDVVTEVVPPEDIVIDRHAIYLENPRVIYQRIRCSVEELCSRFPNKRAQIYNSFSIIKGTYSQRSRFVTYYEAWFTYVDTDGKEQEGVCWFLNESGLILDKMKNPNWLYQGSDKKQKEDNVTERPPKPYVWPNYMNLGRSYIDDTCLLEQAKPLQTQLNRRTKQLDTNIDFMNGRWVASKKAVSDADARKFVNKGARTVLLVDSDDVGKAVSVQTPNQLPPQVFQSVVDYRNEIDAMMGTPSQFKGSTPDRQDTATRDLMLKQQAGALQDDLVRCVASAMEDYYKLLLQMMRVYYTDDYWFQVKGGDGQYEFILLNSEEIDSNVKISIQVDSTLPLDKEQVRSTAMELWKAGQAIDYKTLMEDLGLPEPDIRAERYMQSKIDPVSYLQSLRTGISNTDAELDIQLLVADKEPQPRDEYNADYLAYFNRYVTKPEFDNLPQEAQVRVLRFLMAVQHIASQQVNAQGVLDDASMMSLPPQQPMMPGAPQPQAPGQPPVAPPPAPPM